MDNYRKLNLDTYYRKCVYERFTKVARCSVSITDRIDVTGLYEYSKRTGTKFYINFLYLLAKVMNSRDDYRMAYLWQTDEVIVYDRINPCQYVFVFDITRKPQLAVNECIFNPCRGDWNGRDYECVHW